jgi:hypothetical protein
MADNGLLDEFRGGLGVGYYCGVYCYSGWWEAEEAEWVEITRGVTGCDGSGAMCGYGYCGKSSCYVLLKLDRWDTD